MAKVSIKSEKITPFGGIFHVRELFSRYVGPVIDKVLKKALAEGDEMIIRAKMGEMAKALSLSYIAQKYFGK